MDAEEISLLDNLLLTALVAVKEVEGRVVSVMKRRKLQKETSKFPRLIYTLAFRTLSQ